MQDITNNQIQVFDPIELPLQTEGPFVKKGKGGIILTALLCLAAVFMIFILIFTLSVTLCHVNDRSMMPTLQHDTYVLLSNNTRRVHRGDVVTVNAPDHFSNRPNNPVTLLIKRVIAVGGDTVIWRVCNEETVTYTVYDASNRPITQTHPRIFLYVQLYGTDIPVRQSEEFINGPMAFSAQFNSVDFTHIDGVLTYSYRVLHGFVYVLGDNRNHSADSRTLDSFSLSDVTGRMLSQVRTNSFWERLLLWLYGPPD